MTDRDARPSMRCPVEDVMRRASGPLAIVCGEPSAHPSGLCERHLALALERRRERVATRLGADARATRTR